MKVSELGEFGLIELLSEIVASEGVDRTTKGRPLINIGDDAAAWHSSNLIEIATTDTLVQNVHFTWETITWRELGWKALAVNLSDIGAMGGIPQYAMVSLALPGDTEVDSVSQLYQGLAEIAYKFDTAIVGGNISNAPLLVITISLIGGSAGKEHPFLTRSAARPGESIAVTGYLGSSAAGLNMLKHHLEFNQETTELLRKAHNQPKPRVAEGQLLLRRGVRAAIDISDGLAQDLAHLCKSSEVGARIAMDKIPIHPLVGVSFKSNYLNFALSGGEDYELIFTTTPDIIDNLRDEIGCPVNIIGEVLSGKPGQVDIVDMKGNTLNWSKRRGWNHFASQDEQHDHDNEQW